MPRKKRRKLFTDEQMKERRREKSKEANALCKGIYKKGSPKAGRNRNL